MLEEIRKKVQEKVNLSHKKIIIGYFQKLVDNHNEFCGCNYCKILKEYVLLKKYKSSFLRRYENYGHDNAFDVRLEREYCDNYRNLDNRIKELKISKDKLKRLWD